MNTGAIGAISTHVNSLSTGVNAPVVAGNLSEGQVVDGLVGAVGLAEGMASRQMGSDTINLLYYSHFIV